MGSPDLTPDVFGTGLALGAVDPKNVVVGLALAATIASAASSLASQIAAIALYVSVAVLGVAAPILATVFLGDRSPKVLDAWKAWLGQNNAAVMSVLIVPASAAPRRLLRAILHAREVWRHLPPETRLARNIHPVPNLGGPLPGGSANMRPARRTGLLSGGAPGAG